MTKQRSFNGCSWAEKKTLESYSEMQNVNRSTIKYLSDKIIAGMKLSCAKELCEAYMLKNGADSFWYWDVGAFVFAGDETANSISGKEYKVSDRTIQEDDIITIDLSPQKNTIWGDYARTLVIENSVLCKKTDNIKNDEWKNGLLQVQASGEFFLIGNV